MYRSVATAWVAVWAFGIASIGQSQTYTEHITGGFNRPVGIASAPGDPNRIFVIEAYTGRIGVVDLTTNSLLPTPMLQIDNLATGAEQGLLGLAFDRNFASNGFFYVNYTAADNTTHVERYQVAGDPMTSNVADPNSALTILTINQPQAEHNAGWMEFGPSDGYLYIATGDGGGSNDNFPGHTEGIGNAQDTTGNLLGKILRIDVHGDDFPGDVNRNYSIPAGNPFVGKEGDGEIWAYGLRNPWRNGFDRETGDLWIADVGQSAREEINFQRDGSPGGANYGWRLREGNIATPSGGVGGAEPPDYVAPVYDYTRSDPDPAFGGGAAIGGYVYRGSVDEFVGHYFFADFVSWNVWKLDPDAIDMSASVTNVRSQLVPSTGGLQRVTSFGESANGELYILDLVSGADLFRFATNSRDAVWNGDDPTVGDAGNGTGWGDIKNWTRDEAADTAFVDHDSVVFTAGSSQSLVDLEVDRTVAAVRFDAPYTLKNGTLRVLSGNITVTSEVIATIDSDISAETVNHSIRKLGLGTLLINGESGQVVVKGGTLGGIGTLDHLSVRDGGIVAPGASAGVLSVQNSFNADDGAALSIEIGGTEFGSQFDGLSIGGVASLAGTLAVSLMDGFQPVVGDEFEFITAAGGINGTFDEVDLPVIPDGISWKISYMPNSVSLIAALAGDFNANGAVDAADYTIWRDTFGQIGTGLAADADGDGEITLADYELWKGNFGSISGTSANDSSTNSSVPEPTTLVMLVFGITGMVVQGNRILTCVLDKG